MIKGNHFQRSVAFFALLGLTVYSIDALLNFPAERPVMQLFFALLLALIVNAYLESKRVGVTEQSTTARSIFTTIAVLVLLPAFYINYLTNKSMVTQSLINKDIQLATQQVKWADIENKFPNIPNLNVFCFRIDVINAVYLLNDKQYQKALAALDRSKGLAPQLSIDDNIRAKVYAELKQQDSAYFYAKKAFALRPRAASNFFVLSNACVAKSDSVTLKNAFTEFIKYRNEVWPWKQYIISVAKLNATNA